MEVPLQDAAPDAALAKAIQIILRRHGRVEVNGAVYHPDGRIVGRQPNPNFRDLMTPPETASVAQAASIAAQQAASAARQAALPLPVRVHEALYQNTVLLLFAFLQHALQTFSENTIIALVINNKRIKQLYGGPFISRLKQAVKKQYGTTFGEALSYGVYEAKRIPCPELSYVCEHDYWADPYHGCSCCKGAKFVLSNSKHEAQGRVVVCWSMSPSAMARLRKVVKNGRGLNGRMGTEVAHYYGPDFTRSETYAWTTQQGGTTKSFKMVGPPPVGEEMKLVEAYSLSGDRLLTHHFKTDQLVQHVLQVFGEWCESHLGYAAGTFDIMARDSNGGGVLSYLKVGNVSGLVCSIVRM